MNEFFYKAAGTILAPFRYAEREVQHMKEVAKDDLQALVSNSIKFALMGVAGLLCLIFASTAAAWAINEGTESDWLGHVIVAAFYLLTGVAIYLWKVASEKKREAAKKESYEKEKRQILHERRPVGV